MVTWSVTHAQPVRTATHDAPTQRAVTHRLAGSHLLPPTSGGVPRAVLHIGIQIHSRPLSCRGRAVCPSAAPWVPCPLSTAFPLAGYPRTSTSSHTRSHTRTHTRTLAARRIAESLYPHRPSITHTHGHLWSSLVIGGAHATSSASLARDEEEVARLAGHRKHAEGAGDVGAGLARAHKQLGRA